MAKNYGDEDSILSWMLNRTNSTYDPRTGYVVQFAPTTEDRDYQAVSLPNIPIYGQSSNSTAKYINGLADLISRQKGVGNNNDYFRLVRLITEIMKDPKNIGPNGELNQYGWALLAQQQIAGPDSHLAARKKDAAGKVFNVGLQLAMLPSLVGGFVAAPVTTAGGLIGGLGGATIGAAVGDNFDNPYSGKHYGREIGGILGGLGGGFLGGSYGSLLESPVIRTTPTSSLIRYAFPMENENHTITIVPKEKPFYYSRDGYFKANPNYNFRNGWGLIDDAVETGVIRVPQVPYKLSTFLKYPFLKPSNSFSTMNINFKIPFFLRGEGMWPFKVKIQAPDLIAIPHNSSGVTWPKLGKSGNILTEEAELGQRTTPIINGQSNLFPTSEALLYRLDPTTNMYYSYNPKTITFGEAAGLDLGGLGMWAKYPHRYLDGGISTGDSYYINTPKSLWDPNHKFSLGIFLKGGNINKLFNKQRK